uniref:Uncharacterized protein n=1 Tax=Lygus hesperus TaxID=30085 RepID=A0A146MCH7_LYGHE
MDAQAVESSMEASVTRRDADGGTCVEAVEGLDIGVEIWRSSDAIEGGGVAIATAVSKAACEPSAEQQHPSINGAGDTGFLDTTAQAGGGEHEQAKSQVL